jgi:hypothetical protein
MDTEAIVILTCGGLVIVLTFLGGLGVIFWSFRSRRKAAQSSAWPAVTGVITKHNIQRQDSIDDEGFSTTTYTPQIEYQYSVAGQSFTGKRIAFGFSKGYSRRSKAQEAIADYPLNRQVQVFYNPQNPGEAALERRAGGTIGGIIGGIILLLVSVCIFCPALAIYIGNRF